ncbi:hypothetical protein QBC38DRAFT_417384 [Podospora fimiseda]|uniref:Uncharacterized protein n=1 Tax=Podospora fimiseda TaxID=252190 RepID=A0AAN7BPQ9_9PEZI|nr:hypothetical protein QBC38DRAFT_417384 [Podospora fimiseda]
MATRSKQQESDSEVEVLVHIGAPSLGPDDAKYRAMAAAYSNFKPAIRTKIPIRGGGGSQKQSQKQSQKSISETQFSFEDVDDNHASFVSLPSEVQDSMPDNLATFAGFVSPSRVLDFYTSSLESDSGGSQANRGAIQAKASLVGGAGGSSAGDSSAGKTEGEEEGEEGDKDKTPRRLLFTKKRTPTSYPRDEIDPTDSDEPSLPVSSRKRPRADSSSQSPDPKRPRTAGPLAIDSSTTNDETPTDPMLQIPTTPKKKRQIAERFANKPLDPLTLAVGPLVPDRADHGIISTYDLDTPLLKELMKNLNVAERSRPAQQLRALRHFERGYWVVDVRAWSDDLRRSFWNFLAAFIYRGMGGWGVKAMRNAYEGSFTWVRLYGWGYLTQEMYMLLYLTSQRAVRGVGLRWYDAKHGVCVRMPTVAGGGPTGAQVRPGGPQVAPDPPLGDIADASGIDLEALMNNPAIPDGTTPPPGTPPAADNSQEAAAEGT